MKTRHYMATALVAFGLSVSAQPYEVELQQQTAPSVNHYQHQVKGLTPPSPPAFYTQLWWFGDNYFHFDPNPVHEYRSMGATHDMCAVHTPVYGSGGPPPLSKAAPNPGGNNDPILGPTEGIRLQPYRNAVPGDTVYLIVTYASSQAAAGTPGEIELTVPAPYDALMTYQSGFINNCNLPNNESHLGGLKWHTNSDPGSLDRSVLIPLDVQPGMTPHIGEVIPIRVDIAYDDSTKYADNIELQVAESHDPNTMYPSLLVDEDCKLGSQEITYTIRFQNTGEAETRRVMITSFLDENLDMSSIRNVEVISPDWSCPSHNPCPSYQSLGPNTISWDIHGLRLDGLSDHSCTDAERTKGLLRFTVDVKPGYNMGDDIVCHTEIVFDNNDPVRTNDAITTCPEKLRIEEPNEPDPVKPNPWVITIVVAFVVVLVLILRFRKRPK